MTLEELNHISQIVAVVGSAASYGDMSAIKRMAANELWHDRIGN